jgi:nicotinamidase-related amidase
MSSALIIVDMQPNYIYSKPILSKVIEEIKGAIKEKWLIFALQFAGKIYEEMRSLFQPYKQSYVLNKFECDGTPVLLDYYPRLQFFENLHVVGVETNHCVCETVYGLATRLPKCKINVNFECCNGEFHVSDYQDCWAKPVGNVIHKGYPKDYGTNPIT